MCLAGRAGNAPALFLPTNALGAQHWPAVVVRATGAVVADIDPFADSVFLSRLQKLLPMLGSEQPGEAEAARRKLREHLGHHRLTFLDVAQRLGGATHSVREASLERQLALTRAAREEASRDAMLAGGRVRTLEEELDHTSAELANTVAGQGRIRAWAAAGWCVAIIVAAVSFGPELTRNSRLLHPLDHGRESSATIDLNGPITAQTRAAGQNDASLHLQAGERPGQAAVQDLPIRLSPNDDATVRAFLNQGEHVAIRQEVRSNGQTWLLIRTGTGTGWVRAGDVLH